MTIKITKTETSVLTRTPYHPAFVSGARNLAGKWDAAKQAWAFPSSQETRVRDLCRAVYGTDGTAPTCTLRVALAKVNSSGRNELYIAGRQVLRVFGRDSGAKLGDNVVLVTGAIGSRGSRRNYYCDWSDDAVIELLDCPIPAAREYVREHVGEAWVVGEADQAQEDNNIIQFNR